MTNRFRGAVLASLSAVALTFAVDDTFARSGGAPVAGMAHPHIAPGFGHHHGRGAWNLWPGGGAFFYGPNASEPLAEYVQPLPSDVRYTYTYDVPWDWVHRYPPNVVPSDRPYVPSCPSETVTVPGRGGGEHTVNIMRCY
ncbi:hypothetical protein [Bradyrhizobium sp.]|uniref:hypothetical protein n=1 Tax=Bradyrhizobium sp. TaxID=376 RepID=UPI002391DB91|nr:hypothetical protein [Bradyrhizobium sp.]MDE2376893.1 hypothetical protein [Bradyrhizobium sp.]